MSEVRDGADGGGGQGDLLSLSWRKALLTGLAAVVLVGAAIALIGQAASFHELEHAARSADKRWFPVCLAGELAAYAGYILAYRDVARADGGPVFGYWTVTRVVIVGFGAFVVGSSAGGLAVDYWALHRAGEGTHASARRVLGLNTIDWANLSVAAALAAVAVLAGRGHGAPLAMTLVWITVVPACYAGAAWVSSPARAERLLRLGQGRDDGAAGGRLRRFLHRLRRRAERGLADAIGGVVLIRHLFRHARRYPAGIAGYPIYWAGDILALYAALRSVGVRLDAAPLVLAYASAYVITMLPLPAGGAGGTEAALAYALHAIGVALAPALLAAFVYRIFTFWLPIVPALCFLPTVRKLSRTLPETPSEDELEGAPG